MADSRVMGNRSPRGPESMSSGIRLRSNNNSRPTGWLVGCRAGELPSGCRVPSCRVAELPSVLMLADRSLLSNGWRRKDISPNVLRARRHNLLDELRQSRLDPKEPLIDRHLAAVIHLVTDDEVEHAPLSQESAVKTWHHLLQPLVPVFADQLHALAQ